VLQSWASLITALQPETAASCERRRVRPKGFAGGLERVGGR
jgi:hypothetical protein